jgi:hypothetical protein
VPCMVQPHGSHAAKLHHLIVSSSHQLNDSNNREKISGKRPEDRVRSIYAAVFYQIPSSLQSELCCRSDCPCLSLSRVGGRRRLHNEEQRCGAADVSCNMTASNSPRQHVAPPTRDLQFVLDIRGHSQGQEIHPANGSMEIVIPTYRLTERRRWRLTTCTLGTANALSTVGPSDTVPTDD